MISDKKKFLSISKISEGGISLGNDKKGNIVGVGKNGTSILGALKDVYLVEGLNHNLLSISQLCDKVNKVIFSFVGVRVKRMDSKKVMLVVRRHKKVNKDDIMNILGKILTYLSVIENYPLLWSRRLGHASLK